MHRNVITKSIFVNVTTLIMNQFFIFTSFLNLDSKNIVFENIDVECEIQKIFDVMRNDETFTIKKRMKNICNSIIWWKNNKNTQVEIKSFFSYVMRQIFYNKMWIDYDDINENTINMSRQLMKLLWRNDFSTFLKREYCTRKFFE